MHIYEISNQKLMLRTVSNTFHGRDVFAPAAAHLANGAIPQEFGQETREMVTPEFTKVSKRKAMLEGEVLYIDSFGNIITNFNRKYLDRAKIKNEIQIKLNDIKLTLRFCRTYAEVEQQEPLAIVGSHDFLEISVNQGNAAERFKTKIGGKIQLTLP